MNLIKNFTTAIRDEIKTKIDATESVDKRPLPLNTSFGEQARESITQGLTKLKDRLADAAVNSDIQVLQDISSLTKNFAKINREEVKRKNDLKSMCKGYSYGYYTATTGHHFARMPLYKNGLCPHCNIEIQTGAEEYAGTTRGNITDRAVHESVVAYYKQYKNSEMTLDAHLQIADKLLVVRHLCKPHSRLKSLNLDACPKGSIFKPITSRSQLYYENFYRSKSYGGSLERVIAKFLTMKVSLTEVVQPGFVDIEEFDSICTLLCYLPTPFNRVIDVLMHYYAQTTALLRIKVAFSPAALRQVRIAFARDPEFSVAFYHHLVRLDEQSVPGYQNVFVTVSPRDIAGCYIKTTVLSNEQVDNLKCSAYVANIHEDTYTETTFSLPESEEVLDQQFPSLQVVVEKERLEREQQKHVERVLKTKSPKPAPVESLKANKHKYYGYVSINPKDSILSKAPAYKEFVLGKQGKWDLRNESKQVKALLNFTGRQDLCGPENKIKRSHFVKGLIINAAKSDDFADKNNKLNAVVKPTIPTQNKFAALAEVFSGYEGGGGGKGKNQNKIKVYHGDVAKIGSGMVVNYKRISIDRKSGKWFLVEIPGDGDCFFRSLYLHGLPFERSAYRNLFIKHDIKFDDIASEEFEQGKWVTATDWIPKIQQALTKEGLLTKLNLIMYSNTANVMHSVERWDRSPLINIVYDMDTKNHYEFIYNDAYWSLKLDGYHVKPADDIFNLAGMKNAAHFESVCECNNIYRALCHEMQEKKAGLVDIFSVKLRNKTITFDFTENHDLNREFCSIWNELRNGNTHFKELMQPAQISSVSGSAKKAFKTSDNVCLGGLAERKEQEEKQKKSFAKPIQGQASVVQNKSGEAADEEEIDELIVKEVKPKKNDFTVEPCEYSMSEPEYKTAKIKSLFNDLIVGDAFPEILARIMDGSDPENNTNEYLLDVVKCLQLIKSETFGRTCVTYGQVLDFCSSFAQDETNCYNLGLTEILLKNTCFNRLPLMYQNYEFIQGFVFQTAIIEWDDTLEPFGNNSIPGAYVDVATEFTPWLQWQKAKHSSACDYINAIVASMEKFFSSVNVLGDMFSSILQIFDDECVDTFRISTLTNQAAAAEVRDLITKINNKRDTRSLRDLLTTVKRNPLICTMDIRHYDVLSNEKYQDWVSSYIQWMLSDPSLAASKPTTQSPQEDTHINLISLLKHFLPNFSSSYMIASVTAFMNFFHRFIYPMLVVRQDTKKFSLSALAEFLSAPHIRNALRTTKNHSDMHLKLQHFSNNFGAIDYDAVKNNYGEDLAGSTLYCSAVFLKHLALINVDLENAVCCNWYGGWRKFKGGGGDTITRRMGYGVYCGDLHANHLVFRTDSPEMIWKTELENPHNLRTPILIELPYSIRSHFPHMDNSADNLALGCTNRVARHQEEYPIAFFMFMRKHTDFKFDNFILHPIEPGELLTLDEYLAKTNYTEAEQQTIRFAWLRFCEELKLEVNCNVFVKDESYDLFKAPRQIFSTTNMIKSIVGPLVRTMEKCWFSQIGYHVKGLTNKQRLEKILRMRLNEFTEELLAMDFTAMESHITTLTRQQQNYFAYRFFKNNLYCQRFLDIFFNAAAVREGYTKSREHIIQILSKQASGANETAMNNLQFNEMVQDCADFAYFCYRKYKESIVFHGLKVPLSSFEHMAMTKWMDLKWFDEWARTPNKMDHNKEEKLLLEGDDSLKIAEIGFAEFLPKFFTQMKMEIKVEKFNSLNSASFCGIVASRSGDLIRDSVKTIIKMGSTNIRYMWSKEKKLASLMKLKAECMLHDYYNCPILAAYCRRVIRDINTIYGNDIASRNEVVAMLRTEMSSWEWEQFQYQLGGTIMNSEVNMDTRCLYADVYHIPVFMQLHLESLLNSDCDWSEIINAFDPYIPHEAKLYTSRYVLEQPFLRGCVGETFVPEALRYILGEESHYEVYRHFIATNHDRNTEKCTILF